MAKEIRYSSHIKLRLKIRNIPYELPSKIYHSPMERYFDKAVGRGIAIRTVRYKGKMREMMIVYEEHKEYVAIVTIHPLKKNQKDNRIQIGRWIAYE